MKKQTKYILAFSAIGVITLYAYTRKGKKLDPITEGIKKKFAASNTKFFNTLNPAVKSRFKSFLKDIERAGFAYVITSAYRSPAEQAKLKKINPKNAAAGYSPHNYGIALDINLVKGKEWINKNSTIASWNKTGVPKIAKKYGLEWGGNFSGYHDPVHFADSLRFKTPSLYAAGLKKYGKAELIKGNQLKLAA